MEPLIGSYFANQLVFQSRSLGFRYMANAKAGSTGIKRFLIGHVLKAADPKSDFFEHGNNWTDRELGRDDDNPPFTFSVVRNPFERILSAYLDKIKRPGILQEQFFLQHGLITGQDITFREFLECLAKGDAVIDQHYRPQVQNIYFGYLHFDAIWCLNDMENGLAALRKRFGVRAQSYDIGKHATGAGEKLASYFDDACTKLTCDIFREDFKAFGYSKDPRKYSEAVAPLFNVKPAEKGWFNLLSDIASNEQLPKLPKKVSKSLRFYHNVTSAAADADVSELEKLVKRASGAEQEHYIKSRMVALPGASGKLANFDDHLARLVKIAPYVVQYRLRQIQSYTASYNRQRETISRLMGEAMRITWRTNEVEDIAAKFAETTDPFPYDLMKIAMDFPEIHHGLLEFIAIGLAEVSVDEWAELTNEDRQVHLDQARVALRAERLFFENLSQAQSAASKTK